MKIRIVFCIVLVVLSVSILPEAGAYWLWTPATNRWINPKYEPKESSEAQFEWAMSFYETEDYKDAFKEFKKLVRHYPRSSEAARALFYAGECREKLGDYYKAFEEYQRIAVEYPGSQIINEVLERQFKIGEILIEGEEKKILGVEWSSFLAHDRARQVFAKIIENAPYGEYADKAQFKMGFVFEKDQRYEEAVTEYKKLLKNYPESELIDDTKYRIGLCSYMFSLPSDYDDKATVEARDNFEDFVRQHPESPLAKEVKENLRELAAKEAKKVFDTAKFYEQQGSLEGALIYYQEIVDRYPDTPEAEKAAANIKDINEKVKKEEE